MLKLYPALLLVITLLSGLGGAIIKKIYSKYSTNTTRGALFFNAIVSGVCMIAIFIINGFNTKISTFTIIFGIIFGLVTLLQQITNILALKVGPLSYTQVILSLATIIPTFYGVIVNGDELNAFKIVGIILMVACFILSVNFSSTEKKGNILWLILSLIACICTGIIGILQMEHQNSTHKQELNMFLVIAFLVSTIFSVAIFFIIPNKQKEPLFIEKVKQKNNLLLYIILILFVFSGIFAGFNNVINLHLSGVMSSVILFPILNGGGLILIVLSSFIFFKEKLNLKQWIGISCGIASVIFLCF